MDAVLRNFKTIPCPAGDSCAVSDCQWQHSWEKSHSLGQNDPNEEDENPRKRRKLVAEPESGLTSGSSTSSSSQPSVTAAKPISPPPLKRKTPIKPSNPSTESKVENPPTEAIRAASVKSAGASGLATPARSSHVTTPKTPSQRKAETLNPRHLRGAAPATHDFRFKVLQMLHEQLNRLNKELKQSSDSADQALILSPQELIWMALDEEENIAIEKPSIYSNVIKNRIMSLKRTKAEAWRQERATELKRQEARDAIASGKRLAKPKLGPEVVINTGLTPAEEVKFLRFLLTPIDKLSQYGYVPIAPTEDDIAKARQGEEASNGWEECDRCGSRFRVFPGRREDGSLTSGGTCIHHPGRAYYPESSYGNTGQQEKRYRCCQQTVGEPGCSKSLTHVFKTSAPSRLAALLAFEQTPPNEKAPEDRAVSFDCEMGYTSRGMELIRLTATSWPDGKELLDILVQPFGEVLDLNSRFSGVWPDDFRNAVRSDESVNWEAAPPSVGPGEGSRRIGRRMQLVSSPAVGRKKLFSLIRPETPLIGHGLENDLNAVRVVHPTLVDTILLFPHRRGLPLRYGLKALVETHLQRAIQVDTGTGHDSAEDARATGDLVRFKVQKQWTMMKGAGWRLEDGAFLPPLTGFIKKPATHLGKI